MPQLSLNNWSVPVAEAKMGIVENGKIERAYSGVLRRSRRGVKREWNIRTRPLKHSDAVALAGMVLGRGEYWPADGDVYTSKGLGTYQNNGVIATPGRYTNGFWPKEGTNNLFGDNIATGTDTNANTTGFVLVNGNNGYTSTVTTGTLASSTTQAWQGTRSLLVTPSSTGGAYDAPSAYVAVLPNTQYTVSAYIRSVTGSWNMKWDLFGDTNTPAITQPVTTVVNSAWRRVTATITTTSTNNSLRCGITVPVAAAGTNYSFYTDGWQMELGGTASNWVQGSAPAVNLGYMIDSHVRLGVDAITVAGWARTPKAGGTFAAISGLDPDVSVRLTYSTTNTLTATVVNESGQLTSCSGTWATPTTFAYLALVVLQAPASGPSVMLYLNGALIASASATVPDLRGLTVLSWGNDNGTSPWGSSGVIDELNFYPYAACSGMLTAYANATSPQAKMPQLWAAGDLIYGGAPVAVLGSDLDTDVLCGYVDGAWHNNLASLEFALSEV